VYDVDVQSAFSEAFTEAMSESCSAYYCGSGQSDEMSMDVDVQVAFLRFRRLVLKR
jgi:hypothetical protein